MNKNNEENRVKFSEKDDFENETTLNKHNNRRKDDKYTINYRIVKTIVLILAWVSLGVNLEMIGPTLEDLKIFLNIDYSTISIALILRNVSYLGVTVVFGLFLQKFTNYYELIMAFSSATMALGKKKRNLSKFYKIIFEFFLFFSKLSHSCHSNLFLHDCLLYHARFCTSHL